MTICRKKTDISVALAIYNGESSLPEQLDSILAQSFPVREIVAVDDASTDSSAAILHKYRRRYPELLKVIVKHVNSGSTKTFEEAIAACEGELIFLSDQDDVWQPDKVLKMQTALYDDPVSEGVFADSLLVDRQLKSLKLSNLQKRGFSVKALQSAAGRRAETSQLEQFLCRVPPTAHDMAFRSSVRKLLLPFPELPGCHDIWIGLVIAALSSWAFTPEKLTLFRQHRHNSDVDSGIGTWNKHNRITRDEFALYVQLLDQLISRVESVCSVNTLSTLLECREHFQARAELARPMKQRLPVIVSEWRNSRYRRYGDGIKSVVRDIFLR